MWLPYEYSYSVFDFCLIKKMCVRKQTRKRVEGESKGTRERVRERKMEDEQGGGQSERGLG